MDAFAIISLAIGIFGATFAALASLQRFFANYTNKAWRKAGERLQNVRNNSTNWGTRARAFVCRYVIAGLYILWNLTLFLTILIFGRFAFKFSFDAVKCKNITDTKAMWSEYVGCIVFMQKAFIVLFILGIVFLALLWIANAVLTGMSEMVETQATQTAFQEPSDD